MYKFLSVVTFIFVFFFIILIIDNLDKDRQKLEERVELLEEMLKKLEQNFGEMKGVVENMSPDSLFNKEWFLFKLALIKQESNFNEKAVNQTHGDGGLYQILPVGKSGFLSEANRLLGYIEFDDSCRFDPERSTEIFEIINQKYNPGRCIEAAIRLHNPLANNDYRDKILRNYELLKSISYEHRSN